MFWSLFDHFWQKLLAVIWILLAGKESHLSWSHNSSVLLERQVGHPRTLQDRRGWVWFPIAPRVVYSPSPCSMNSQSWFCSKLQRKISIVFQFETFSSVNSLRGVLGQSAFSDSSGSFFPEEPYSSGSRGRDPPPCLISGDVSLCDVSPAPAYPSATFLKFLTPSDISFKTVCLLVSEKRGGRKGWLF